MQLDEKQIRKIVERVANRLAQAGTENIPDSPPGQKKPEPNILPEGGASLGCFPDVDAAICAAEAAHQALDKKPLDLRRKIIEAMRNAARENAAALARMAVEETGYGRYEDKLKKNLLAASKTPGVEILKPVACSGDCGLTLTERAPYGVIAAITPVTNPIATIVNNSIGMLAGGNAVVFNPHPAAAGVSIKLIQLLNQAIIDAGGPADLLTTVMKPSIQTAQALMKHPGIRLLVVTGGPAVVRVAMQSGKKVIAAGPGNPPAVVDETADIPRAARDIVAGASFDNNIVCVLEKETIAVDKIADELKAEMRKAGAYEINSWQIRKLKSLIIEKDNGPGKEGVINKAYVGKNAQLILKEIGITSREDVRLILAEVDREHVFFWTELLMPVMPLVRVKDVDAAIILAKEVEQGNRHTAVMHSRNIDSLSKMARTINTSIFIKNGPSYAGLGFCGEGYTSFTIASPTGEGLTTAVNFTRERRCTLVDSFRIV
jgi:acyl-CoA reductase-like NAD-dependent aldehyde dehydrogenase